MKKTNRQKKWKYLTIIIWIFFLVAAFIGCYSLNSISVYNTARTELTNQAEIISRHFPTLVDTDYYSRVYLSKRLLSEIKAVSFALENYDDIGQADDFLKDIVNTTEIKNLLIYDRDGNIVFGSGGTADIPIKPDFIPALLDSKEYELAESSFNSGDRYLTVTYLLGADYNSILWGVKDKWLVYANDIYPDTLKNVVESLNWNHALQDISISRDGTVLAVSERDGCVLSYSDPDAKGKPLEDLNLTIAGNDKALSASQLLEAFPQAGEVKEIRLDSVRYYATRMNMDTDLFLMMFPVEKIEREIFSETAIIMAAIAFFTFIGVLYLFCLASSPVEQSQSHNEQKGRSLALTGSLKVFTILAVILIFVLSLYLETHLRFSRMFQYTSSTAESVMQKKSDSDKMLSEFSTWSERGNLEKSRIVRCIVQHTDQKRVDRQYITDLAERLNVKSIYVFDKEGKVSVTNAPYDGIILDKDSPFHALLEGTESVIRKPDQEELSGEGMQEAGVMMLDENNLVAGAVVIANDAVFNVSADLNFDAVFQRVFLKDNTVVIAVDSENMKVQFFAQVDGSFLVSDQLSLDYSDKDIKDLGLDEKVIRDHFNGELFAIDNQYFASIRRNGNSFLMVLSPLVFIDTVHFLFVIYATVAALLFYFLLIFVAGRFKTVPAEDSGADDKQAAEKQKEALSAPNTDKDEDDVLTLLESLTNENDPDFKERWPSDGKKWSAKTPLEKFSTVVKLTCIISLVLVFINVAVAGKDSIFYYSFSGEWNSGINLYSITSCIIVVFVLILLKEILHVILYWIATTTDRKGETICLLLNSFSGYILFIAGVIIILLTIGVDLTTMSLTAGVAGIIFGIGCQNIVADILAGIIMTFEGVVCAGDFVLYKGASALVQSVGVRTTTLKWHGEIKVVRNNEFKDFVNIPDEAICRVVGYLSIDLKESINRVESIINKELPLIHKNLCEAIGYEIERPLYRGVQSIENSGITLSFAVFCKGRDSAFMNRQVNRELLLMCERNGICLAMPQIVINEPKNREG